VQDRTGVDIPDSDDYDTIAGFVLRELGRIPDLGDEVPLDDGAVLRVERMEGRRISRLRYLAPPLETALGAEIEPGPETGPVEVARRGRKSRQGGVE
jgi:Mg2+/Co2+ transporter CorC